MADFAFEQNSPLEISFTSEVVPSSVGFAFGQVPLEIGLPSEQVPWEIGFPFGQVVSWEIGFPFGQVFWAFGLKNELIPSSNGFTFD